MNTFPTLVLSTNSFLAIKRESHLQSIGHVEEIWRHPVSSMGGERVEDANIEFSGVVGDRRFALIDANSGAVAAPERDTRWRSALYLQARDIVGELPKIVSPDGTACSLLDPQINKFLSNYFGFATAIGVHEARWQIHGFPLVPYRAHHFPIHLLASSSLAHLAQLREVEAVDVRRFRPSILIRGEHAPFAEGEWIGREIRVGTVVLSGIEETKRCGMTLIPQPHLEYDPDILRSILRYNKRNLGAYCGVQSAGCINVGDEIFLV